MYGFRGWGCGDYLLKQWLSRARIEWGLEGREGSGTEGRGRDGGGGSRRGVKGGKGRERRGGGAGEDGSMEHRRCSVLFARRFNGYPSCV